MDEVRIQAAKTALRTRIWKAQWELPPKARRQSDDALRSVLLKHPLLKNVSSLFLFVGVSPEPETKRWIEPLLALGKTVSVPLCHGAGEMEACRITGTDQLHPGKYGILEPDTACPVLSPKEIELTLVPGVCFGQDGSRLGRGGGYYDRWLQNFTGVSVGVCRQAFLQSWLPTEPHDQKVQMILTEQGLFNAASPGNGAGAL